MAARYVDRESPPLHVVSNPADCHKSRQTAGLGAFCTYSIFSVFRVFSRFPTINCDSFYTVIPFAIPAKRVLWIKLIEATENRVLSTHLFVLAS